jgi:hypothetical protein
LLIFASFSLFAKMEKPFTFQPQGRHESREAHLFCFSLRIIVQSIANFKKLDIQKIDSPYFA